MGASTDTPRQVRMKESELMARAVAFLDETKGHPLRREQLDEEMLMVGLLIVAARAVGFSVGQYAHMKSIESNDNNLKDTTQPVFDGHMLTLSNALRDGIIAGVVHQAQEMSKDFGLTVIR